MPHRRRSLLAAGTAALAAPRPVLAQPTSASPAGAWPRGPIRIVAPFPPGGSVDTLARLIQQPLQAELGVPVVVGTAPARPARSAPPPRPAPRRTGKPSCWCSTRTR